MTVTIWHTSDPAIRAAIEQAVAEPDAEKRVEMLAKIDTAFAVVVSEHAGIIGTDDNTNDIERITFAATDILGRGALFYNAKSSDDGSCIGLDVSLAGPTPVFRADMQIKQFDPTAFYQSEYNKYAPLSQFQESTVAGLSPARVHGLLDTLFNASFARMLPASFDNAAEPVAVLVSGGLVSGMLLKYLERHHVSNIVVYVVGMDHDRNDIKHASYMLQQHFPNIISEGRVKYVIIKNVQRIAELIEPAIRITGSYDTNCIRIATINCLLAKVIREHHVISGFGLNELFAGHISYAYGQSNKIVRKVLMEEIGALFDHVTRANYMPFAALGHELHCPFFTWSVASLVMQANTKIYSQRKGRTSKHFFRLHFADMIPKYCIGRPSIEITSGIGEAFIDYLREGLNIQVRYDADAIQEIGLSDNRPNTVEQKIYRTIYERYYPEQKSLVSGFWFPPFMQNMSDYEPASRFLHNFIY